MLFKFLRAFVILLALPAVLSAANQKPPIKPKMLLIADKELLGYSVTVSGERYQDVKILSRISPDGKTLNAYIGKYTLGSKYKMPDNYSNWQRQFTIDLQNGSLIGGFGNYIPQSKVENLTGEVYFSLDIDTNKNIALYTSKIWDGYDMMEKKVRVKLFAGYPVWDVPSIAFVGSRFLDIRGDGIIYGVYPTVVKEAVPVTGKIVKKETITTPAGKFNTLKIGIGITDQFLAQLLDTYVKELYLWVEDSPRGLIIRTQSPEEIYELESIGTWKD